MIRNLSLSAAVLVLLASLSFAQTSSLEGDVKGEDGQPLKGALVKIDRKDIKGSYKVKTDKKGHYFHAGLPLGMYKLTVEVDGKDRDSVDNVRTRLGDPVAINFDLHGQKEKQAALQQAAATGTWTKEQEREMSPEQKAALKKAADAQAAEMKKNKDLNDAFNTGMQAIESKQWDAAVQSLTKASEVGPTQVAVWSRLAEAYTGLAGTKTGSEQEPVLAKAIEAYNKALELQPNDAAVRNNYALALVKAKKIPEAQAELAKAAQLDPAKAGQYFYNLGAVLTNAGQADAAGEAFKKAIETQPDYAEAQYQYGVYLLGKAQTSADGKITPVPGTVEAFQKYLELAPNGPNSEAAKGMIASMGSTVTTEFKNPAAAAQKKGSTKKK